MAGQLARLIELTNLSKAKCSDEAKVKLSVKLNPS